MQAARDYAAELYYMMAAECFDADYGFADHVTHTYKQTYRDLNIKVADDIRAGLHDNTFTIRQRMDHFLTIETTQ